MKTGRDLIAEIDSTRLAQGELAFWWLGQLSYVVKVGDLVFYLDPFLTPLERRNVPPLFKPEEITNADFVLGTHDHLDHIDPIAFPGIAKASPQARLVCPRAVKSKVLSLGVPEERVIPLDEGLVFEDAARGVRISAIAAAHEFLDRDSELGFKYLSYIIEVGGLTIYHSGDTCLYDGMIAKLSRWELDLMFVPINGRDAERFLAGTIGNMTYQEAVDLAGAAKPRLVVPGHYEMFNSNLGDVGAFGRYLEAKYPGQRYWAGEHGVPVRLAPAGA